MVKVREDLRRFASGREIVAVGLDRSPFHDVYHRLLTMSWRRFFALVFAGYLVVNAAFAAGYYAEIDGIENAGRGSFSDAFFFSVQTLATIGYGRMAPRSLLVNLLVTAEALLGILGLAVTTGLVYARFARPTAQVLFSKVAVVAPYEGVPSLMFRMANARGTQIVEARLKLALVRNETTREGEAVRRVHDLRLLRAEHAAFALSWTAIHPIDAASPLHGQDAAAMRATMSDLVVSLTGIEEGLAQTIHARYAYGPDDIAWGARFADILAPGPERSVIDYARFHDTEPFRAPAGAFAHPVADRASPPHREAGKGALARGDSVRE
jgi:inward rectifier potassium channel